jgi:hypothetical protein
MRTTEGLFKKKNGYTKEYSISIRNQTFEKDAEDNVNAKDGDNLYVFEYAANDMLAEDWEKVFIKLMEKDSRPFELGQLIFDLTVVEYDSSIDEPTNSMGLFKHKIMCQFASQVDQAFIVKADDIKKK